jgi:hypothetical protein
LKLTGQFQAIVASFQASGHGMADRVDVAPERAREERLVVARLLFLVFVFVVGACRGLDDPAASFGIFFPRHGLGSPHALAPLEGRLEVSDGCLWLVERGGTRRLPIWPGRCGLRRSAAALQVTDSAGRVVATEGETVTLVGGQYPADAARQLMGRDEPTACRGDGFWVVGEIAGR